MSRSNRDIYLIWNIMESNINLNFRKRDNVHKFIPNQEIQPYNISLMNHNLTPQQFLYRILILNKMKNNNMNNNKQMNIIFNNNYNIKKYYQNRQIIKYNKKIDINLNYIKIYKMVKYKLILNKILKCYYLYIIAKLNNISKIIYLFKAGIHKYKPSKLSIESESIHIQPISNQKKLIFGPHKGFKYCKCLQQNPPSSSNFKFYLQIKTIPYHSHNITKQSNMCFDQIIQFTQLQKEKGKIFVSLLSSIDYKGFAITTNKIDVNIEFLKDVQFLSVLYREKTIQKQTLRIFDFNYCGCNIKSQHQKSRVRVRSPEEIRQKLEQQIPKVNKLEVSRIKQSSSQCREIFQVIEDQASGIKNEAIIQVIKKRIFQRYYLHCRFDQTSHELQYINSDYKLHHDPDYLFQGNRWAIKDEEYVFINQEELKIQKGVLKLIIKQITSNIFAGKSIMTMSLPVEIFLDKSMTQGLIDILGFVPKYMHEAVKHTNPVEQIKYIAAGFLFIFACHPKVAKPFNPILGQTYQGYIGGISVCAEQISHHPPITAFYMKNDKFQAYGNFDIHVQLGLNAAYSKNYGLFHVRIFSNNTHFIIKYTDLQVGGVMFGNRSIKLKGKGYIFQQVNNIYLQYSVGKQSKKLYEYSNKLKNSDLAGGIFKVTKQFASKVLKEDKKKSTQGARPQDVIQKYSQITGKWYGDLYFDGIEYKSYAKGPFPILPQRTSPLLPSDCLFRQDVVYKRWNNNNLSNENKQILQNLQRKDKKLRQKYKK